MVIMETLMPRRQPTPHHPAIHPLLITRLIMANRHNSIILTTPTLPAPPSSNTGPVKSEEIPSDPTDQFQLKKKGSLSRMNI
mmetsp:Transcript_3463/g.7626  ORF Transcript_3463/g.7626 Transcript_3463/m.7626 type:complete len:82 (+) Transcript_3463:577-822(+)